MVLEFSTVSCKTKPCGWKFVSRRRKILAECAHELTRAPWAFVDSVWEALHFVFTNWGVVFAGLLCRWSVFGIAFRGYLLALLCLAMLKAHYIVCSMVSICPPRLVRCPSTVVVRIFIKATVIVWYCMFVYSSTFKATYVWWCLYINLWLWDIAWKLTAMVIRLKRI